MMSGESWTASHRTAVNNSFVCGHVHVLLTEEEPPQSSKVDLARFWVGWGWIKGLCRASYLPA
jgi:hypothetical protein